MIPVHTLLAQERLGSGTKALSIVSINEKEPERYEVEIQQPPTRDDWITGIREAVDASRNVDDDEEEDEVWELNFF